MSKLPKIIILIFFLVFIIKGFQNIATIPFHDFDEANRTEGARNMKRYKFYLAPITGSPFHRVENLKIKAKNNPRLNLYYHLERPPLVFLSMNLATAIFKEKEMAYRLPSFIFGILIFSIFLVFFSPLSAISILLSKDLWLSSQQALLDTALSFFLFLAVLFLLGFSKTKKRIFLVLSSCSWSLAFLSKGQPALIFLFFLAFFIFHKKINLWEVFLLGFVFLFISLLWLIPLFQKFGPETFLKVFLGFAGSRALESDPTQNAPVFWYARWLFESVRAGWVMFLVLAFNDFVKKKLTFEKSALLFYFFSSFFLFSFAKNKVWWYILPLVPIVGLYIYLSSKDYLKNKSFAFKIHLILLVSSLPVFYSQRNIIAVILLFLYVAFGFLILQLKISFQKLSYPFGIFSLVFALTIFYLNFPKVSPYYPEVKRVGEYYKKLSQPKCLYLENMPYESALFYTEAEEVNYFKNINQLDKSCNNYLLTPNKKNYPLVFHFQQLKLYFLKE